MNIQGRKITCKTQTNNSKSVFSQRGDDVLSGENQIINKNVLCENEITKIGGSITQTCSKFTSNYDNYQQRGRVRPGDDCSGLSSTESYKFATHNLSSFLLIEPKHQLETSISASTEEGGHKGSKRKPGVPSKAIEENLHSEPNDR